jgi:hypothetical protein
MDCVRRADDVRGDIQALQVIADSLLDGGVDLESPALLAVSLVLADRRAELKALAGHERLHD